MLSSRFWAMPAPRRRAAGRKVSFTWPTRPGPNVQSLDGAGRKQASPARLSNQLGQRAHEAVEVFIAQGTMDDVEGAGAETARSDFSAQYGLMLQCIGCNESKGHHMIGVAGALYVGRQGAVAAVRLG
jgi:hypothetical protein